MIYFLQSSQILAEDVSAKTSMLVLSDNAPYNKTSITAVKGEFIIKMFFTFFVP